MISINKSKRAFRRTAGLMAGVAVTVAIGLTAFTSTADAEWNGHHRNYRHNWNGGYYRAPPVVYGSTYGRGYYGAPNYYPPPVVYGPSYGPGIVVRIN